MRGALVPLLFFRRLSQITQNSRFTSGVVGKGSPKKKWGFFDKSSVK
jgi:hypothetical protein